MPVGLLTLELHIPDAQSLKDKRQVIRSLKDKLRRQFNVAVAELDHHDLWQRSVVGVVTLSNEVGLMSTYARMQVNQTRKDSAGKA